MNEVLRLPHPWRSFHARVKLRQARRDADDQLLLYRYPPLRLAWRVEELTAGRRRTTLARSLRRLVDAAEPRVMPGAAIVNRPAIREERDRLLRIARRLVTLDRPVAARGVLLIEDLLRAVDGPLYVREDRYLLGPALDDTLDALEPLS
jgi:hypothetical protein